MALYIILIFAICHLVNAEQCSPRLRTSVRQITFASRPVDQVTLTCTLSGSMVKNIESYMWIIHETNRPIYVYLVLDPNDITGNISSPQVLNETHSITSTGIVSRLVLNVSVVEPKIYQCQFNLRDGQKCRENIEVNFKDAVIKVLIDRTEFRYGEDTSVANITCRIDESAGHPHINIRYIGKGRPIQILSEEVQVEDMGHYLAATYHARLRLPTIGHILCEVTDDLGTYRATDSIESVNCPDHIDLQIRQDNVAQRPEDIVVLTCSLNGVPLSQLEYYWWLVDEVNVPLYIFSEKFEMDKIPHKHPAEVVNETHISGNNTLVTKLRIRVNVTNKTTYKCDFTFHDYTSCEKTTPIIFKDPPISIRFDTQPIASDYPYHKASQASLHEVNCTVNATIGEPNFEIGYTGDEEGTFKIEKTSTVVKKHGDYFGGIYRALVRLPQAGQIDCKVMDMAEHFAAHKSIIVRKPRECPGHINLQTSRDSVAQQPEDVAILSCNLTGVTRSQLKHYWWLFDELNEPLYFFSGKHGLDEIAHIGSSEVLNEIHTFTENSLETKLYLRVQIKNNTTYRCHFVIQNHARCEKSIPVIFKGTYADDKTAGMQKKDITLFVVLGIIVAVFSAG